MSVVILVVFASVVSPLGVQVEVDSSASSPGAESQYVEIGSHHFEDQHPSENAGRMMRKTQRADDLFVQIDAAATPSSLLQATRFSDAKNTDDSRLDAVAVLGSIASSQPDVTWGDYQFMYIGNTSICKEYGNDPDAQSFFRTWSGFAEGLTITDGTTVEFTGGDFTPLGIGMMKPTSNGLQIYKSACADETALTIGGGMLLPKTTEHIDITFGITQRCTGNCAPFAVSLWDGDSGRLLHRWCWDHQGGQVNRSDPARKIAAALCHDKRTAEFAKWHREILNISQWAGKNTKLHKMDLEVYTSGDYRFLNALPDEVGDGGRAMVLIDSLILGPVVLPTPVSTYEAPANPCRPTQMQVCGKNTWCFEKFRCSSGWCTNGTGRCNKKRNCDDDSDEVGCEYDNGFLGTFYLNHERFLQDSAHDDPRELVEGLQDPTIRLMHQQISYQAQDFWDQFHVKEYFAAKFTGNISITTAGNYYFHWKDSGQTHVSIRDTSENADHSVHEVINGNFMHFFPGLYYEMTVSFVHRKGDPKLELGYQGPDTVDSLDPIIVPREVLKTTMTGARCDTMICASSESLVAKKDNANILCKGVPCDPAVDTATCCQREYKVIAAGDHQTCGLDQRGRPVCWGSWPAHNGSMAFNTEWKNHPGPYVDLSTRSTYTCGVKENSEIDCWTATGTKTFAVDYSANGLFTNVTVGGEHICALRDTGFLACTGADPAYQAFEFDRVAAGPGFTCGIKSLGKTVTCWGANDRGQAHPPDGQGYDTYTHLAAGMHHMCGVSAGDVHCWGENQNGQATPPTSDSTFQGLFAEVAPGGSHTCALTTNGTAVCWGDNSNGQATPLEDDAPFKTLSSGRAHTCGIKIDDSTAVCWGSNFEDVVEYDAAGVKSGTSPQWRGQAAPPPAGYWP